MKKISIIGAGNVGATAAFIIAGNLLADVTYILVNPKIGDTGSEQ